MAIETDVSVDTSKNVRWTGDATTQYTVLELHRFLNDLADDQQASGDDIVDITSSTPSERSTDNIITLINSYNIDDTMSQHLYDGSVSQNGGDDLYSGLIVSGALYDSNTEIMIIQDDKILANYWGTGINVDAANNILLQCMVKTRSGGADIDGKRLRVATRELGSIFAEFNFTAGDGNSYPALFSVQDLNNETAFATIAGWITITNVEGYQEIDLGNGNGAQPYYSQWNKATYTINQLYERTKFIEMRAGIEDDNTTADQDNALGNGTITKQGQSFTVGSNAMYLRRVRVKLKVGAGSPTGNMTAYLYAHTGTYGTSSTPTGAAVATSNTIPSDRVTAAYVEYEFVFDTPYELTDSTYYCIEIDYTGDASNYISIYGNSTSVHDGNRFDYDTGYNADLTEDLWFELYTSFDIHGRPGELMRGINLEIDWDNQTVSDTFDEDEILSWGSGATAGTGIILADSEAGADAGQTGTSWIQLLTGVNPTDGMQLSGGTSGVTADVNGAPTARTIGAHFFAQSTGTAIIGTYGIGVESADLTNNDMLFDLTNTQQIPPNNVTWTLYGLVAGDRILVGPKDTGDAFKFAQMALATALTGAAETIVDVGAGNIPANTPASGTLRIELDTGIYRYQAYTSHDGDDEFTIASSDYTDPNDAGIGNDVMVSYIDKASAGTSENFQTIHTEDLSLRIRVRDGGATPIKTFETNSTLVAAGGSATASRVSDE